MSFLLKEYEIPFMGKIQLIEATGYDKCGGEEYYSRYEKGPSIVRNCNSLEELEKRTYSVIEESIENKKRELLQESEEIRGKLTKIESLLLNLRKKDFLPTLETHNELELRVQRQKL